MGIKALVYHFGFPSFTKKIEILGFDDWDTAILTIFGLSFSLRLPKHGNLSFPTMRL